MQQDLQEKEITWQDVFEFLQEKKEAFKNPTTIAPVSTEDIDFLIQKIKIFSTIEKLQEKEERNESKDILSAPINQEKPKIHHRSQSDFIPLQKIKKNFMLQLVGNNKKEIFKIKSDRKNKQDNDITRIENSVLRQQQIDENYSQYQIQKQKIIENNNSQSLQFLKTNNISNTEANLPCSYSEIKKNYLSEAKPLKMIQTKYGHLDTVNKIFQSQDKIFTLGQDSVLKVWNSNKLYDERIQLQESIRNQYPIISGAINNQYLVLGNLLGGIEVYQTEKSLELKWNWNIVKESLLSLSLKKNKLLCCSESQIQLWNLGEQKILHRGNILSEENMFKQVEWIDSKEFLLLDKTQENLNNVYLYDFEQEIKQKISSKEQINIIQPLNEKNCVYGDQNGNFGILDMNQGKNQIQWKGHEEQIQTIDYKENYIVSGCIDGYVRLWDLRMYKCVASEYAHCYKNGQSIQDVRFGQQESLILSSGVDGQFNLFMFQFQLLKLFLKKQVF